MIVGGISYSLPNRSEPYLVIIPFGEGNRTVSLHSLAHHLHINSILQNDHCTYYIGGMFLLFPAEDKTPTEDWLLGFHSLVSKVLLMCSSCF